MYFIRWNRYETLLYTLDTADLLMKFIERICVTFNMYIFEKESIAVNYPVSSMQTRHMLTLKLRLR